MKRGRVVHCRREDYDIYVGRGKCPRTGEEGLFGNPFVIGKDGDREDCIRKYEEYIRAEIARDNLVKLAVKCLFTLTLGCWCSPKPCHGDILLKIAEELVNENT